MNAPLFTREQVAALETVILVYEDENLSAWGKWFSPETAEAAERTVRLAREALAIAKDASSAEREQ